MIFWDFLHNVYQKILCYYITPRPQLFMIYLFPLTRELRALHGAWATPRSSSILEKTERSSARSICRGLVPRMFTPFRCNGAARLLGIWPPTDTMLPEQPWGGEEVWRKMCKLQKTAGRIKEKKGIKEWGLGGGGRTAGEILYQALDLLPENHQPRLTVWNLWPLPIILAADHTVKLWDKQKLLITVAPQVYYHQGLCVCVCVCALLLITACCPFSCLADPKGMLFPWQCQVISLHYSWACSPAPVQGLSPCSNAVFITHSHKHTHTHRERGDCSHESWIDGNAITLNKQTLITLWSHRNFN